MEEKALEGGGGGEEEEDDEEDDDDKEKREKKEKKTKTKTRSNNETRANEYTEQISCQCFIAINKYIACPAPFVWRGQLNYKALSGHCVCPVTLFMAVYMHTA